MNPHPHLLLGVATLAVCLTTSAFGQSNNGIPDFGPAIQQIGRSINQSMKEKKARDEAYRQQEYDRQAAAEERRFEAEQRKREAEQRRQEREAELERQQIFAQIAAEEAAARKAEINGALGQLRELAAAGKPAQALATAQEWRQTNAKAKDFVAALDPLIAELSRQAGAQRSRAEAQNSELTALLDTKPAGSAAARPDRTANAKANDPLDAWLLSPASANPAARR
jgi:hypothetical protein